MLIAINILNDLKIKIEKENWLSSSAENDSNKAIVEIELAIKELEELEKRINSK